MRPRKNNRTSSVSIRTEFAPGIAACLTPDPPRHHEVEKYAGEDPAGRQRDDAGYVRSLPRKKLSVVPHRSTALCLAAQLHAREVVIRQVRAAPGAGAQAAAVLQAGAGFDDPIKEAQRRVRVEPEQVVSRESERGHGVLRVIGSERQRSACLRGYAERHARDVRRITLVFAVQAAILAFAVSRGELAYGHGAPAC
jgi:hypothetical protein